jgi:hypothetical protein
MFLMRLRIELKGTQGCSRSYLMNWHRRCRPVHNRTQARSTDAPQEHDRYGEKAELGKLANWRMTTIQNQVMRLPVRNRAPNITEFHASKDTQKK